MNDGKSRLTRRFRSKSEPPRNRHRFVEQHYVFDKENMALLPGVHEHSNDMARDLHDFFNLMILVRSKKNCEIC